MFASLLSKPKGAIVASTLSSTTYRMTPISRAPNRPRGRRAVGPGVEYYQRLVETTHEGICVVDVDSRIVFANGRLCEMLGYARKELVGASSMSLLDKNEPSGSFEGAFHESASGQHEVALRHKNGSTVWASVRGAPMLDEAGQPSGVLTMFSDISERRSAEQGAREAVERIEGLTADAVYSVDRSGRIRSWNSGAEQIFGWSKVEAVGHFLALVPENLRPEATTDVLQILEKGHTISKETERLTKQGRAVPVLGSWSPIPLDNGETGVLCLLKDISAYKEIHAQLDEQARSLALLRDRERIAMDLHDGVIQSLYGVALRLGALRRQDQPRQPEYPAESADAVLGQAITELTETIQGIRDYIYDLRKGLADDGDLAAGLSLIAEQLSKSDIQPLVRLEADVSYLTPDSVRQLLYIAHEATSNVVRHANASRVDILLESVQSHGMVLKIADNGSGFEPNRRGGNLGDGLHNMRQRARLIGGRLTIASQLGSGTVISVRLP